MKRMGMIMAVLALAGVGSACSDSGSRAQTLPEDTGTEPSSDGSRELQTRIIGLVPRLVTVGDSVLSVSGSPIDSAEISAFDALEFDGGSQLRYLNVDGTETVDPVTDVDNARLRSVQRIDDISLISTGDYSPTQPAGTDLSSVIEMELLYRQLDGAPFAILADGSVINDDSNPFESPDEIEARRAEMPVEFAIRLVEGPATTSLHTFTLLVSLDDGRQLEVAWPTLTIE